MSNGNNNHRSLGELIWHRTGNKPVLQTPEVAAAKAGIGGVFIKKDSASLDDRIEYEKWSNAYADAYAKWFDGEESDQIMRKSVANYKQRVMKSLGLSKADIRAQNILSTMETVQSAYVAPSVSGIGPAKQMLTEWWFNPIWGQPRLVDLRTIKQLARSHIGSMAVEAILDQIMQVGWDIVPKDLLHPNLDETQQQISKVKDFLDDPNRNHDDFDKILRMYIRNILETDDGTLVLAYDEYVSPPVPQSQYAATGEIRAYTAQPAWDAIPAPDARLIEVFSEDGASFLKQVDMHGYLMNFWQYSFIVPRRPIRFEVNEIVYTMQNPRSGSPYGYSPFESIVDTLKFLIEAFKYQRAFFENSAIPSLHIDFEFIKDPKDLKALDDWIRETFVGSDKAYRVLTTNGGVNVKTLNFTNRDLQMLELQTFYLNLVLAKLKVPSELLGIRPAIHAGYASRGSMGTQAALLRSRAIKPLLTLVENSFNTHLVPKILDLPRKECLAQFKFGPMTDLDEQERKAKIYQAYLSTGLGYINEFRISEGKDPVPWGYFPFIPQVGLVHPLEPYSVQWFTAIAGKPGQGPPGSMPRQSGETPPSGKPPETPAQQSPGPSSVESFPKPEEGVGAEVPSITHAGGQPLIETLGPTGKMWYDKDLEEWLLGKLAEHSHLIRKGRKDKTIEITKKVHNEVLNTNIEAGKKLKALLTSARDFVLKGEDPDVVESKTLDGARKVINEWLEANALLAKQDVAKEMKLPIPKELSEKDLTGLRNDKEKATQDFHGVLMDMILALKSKLAEKR